MSYIFIWHDLAVVKYISDQVMVMSEERGSFIITLPLQGVDHHCHHFE